MLDYSRTGKKLIIRLLFLLINYWSLSHIFECCKRPQD